MTRAGDAMLTAWVDVMWSAAHVAAKVNDGEPFIVAGETSAKWVRVATDGNDFVVLWTTGYPEVFARRVLRDGTMPAPAVKVSLQGWHLGPSCVTWTGTEYVAGFVKLIEWTPRGSIETEVWARRITREGALSGEEFRIASGSGGVACASTPETTLFVWGYSQIEGATLTRGGTISAPFPITRGQNAVVATNGRNFLVAAHDRFSQPPAHLIQRATVSELGTVMLKPEIIVEPIPYELETPAVGPGANGGYLLVYGTAPLRAQPLDGEGNLEGVDLILAREGAFAAVTRGVVVYQRDTANFTEPRWRLFARTLSEFGQPRRRLVRR